MVDGEKEDVYHALPLTESLA